MHDATLPTTSSHTYPNIRIYALMRPDTAGLRHLKHLQTGLPPQRRGRMAPHRGLHMTLIHFGKVRDVYEHITAQASLSYDDYMTLLKQYIDETNGLLPRRDFVLEPRGFARFGMRGGTLVVEYLPPIELSYIHAELYQALRRFLQACNLRNIDAFIMNDPNFMHAQVFRAHITLYKGYLGELPDVALEPVRVYPMQLVYPPVH